MNKIFGLTGFTLSILLVLFIPTFASGQDPPLLDTEATISMDLQDANLKDILKILSMQSGLNFIASEGVQDRVITLYLDKVPLQEAMDNLFKANNLYYELNSESNIFIVKDWGKPQIETVTKVFYLKYAAVSSSPLKGEVSTQMSSSGTTSTTSSATTGGTGGGGGIAEAVKKILSNDGSVIEDYRTNSLVVTDVPSRIPLIAEVIASLDIPAPQVMLEVEMLDVSKNTVDALGFEFDNNPFTVILPGSFVRRGAEFFIGDMTDRGKEISSSAVAGSLVLGRNFAQVLDFLRTQTDTKYLARPRLLTLNNETAEIKIATSESIGVMTSTASEGTTTAQPERADTGVSLRVTPQINIDTGEITMFIYPQVSEATQGNTLTSAGQSYQYRDPEIRSTKSIVKVKDNETVILGGLIRNELTQTIKKLPLLGDIPILGALFRHKSKTKDRERELLVFITPHIIKDGNAAIAAAKNGVLPAREQNFSSLYGRKLEISSSLDNFEKIMK